MEKQKVDNQIPTAAFFGFEATLGVIAIAISAWGTQSHHEWSIGFESSSLQILGVALAVSAILAFLLTSDFAGKIKSISGIEGILQEGPIGDFIRRGSISDFALISLAAGFGEELIFRGIIQIEGGIWLGSLIFALFHFVSPAYFLISFATGALLGWVFQASGNHILIPILAHALYDFVALIRYRRKFRAVIESEDESFSKIHE